MSMEWLRWYHGAVSDDKWPLIARKSGQTVAVVIAVWAALLECASQDDDRGSIEAFDPESIDALLQLDDGATQAVIDALSSGKRPRIVDGHIVNWGKRQPVREDGSAERAREWRERKKQEKSTSFDNSNADRTQAERRPNAPRTQTNTDKRREEKKREEYISPESLENEERARAEDNAGADTGCTDEPSIDFLELRRFWDEHFRPEGPLAGFAEYKQLRAARAYPGDSRIYDDLQARIDFQCWNQGFAISLARYLRERTWEAPPKARAAPEQKSWQERQDEANFNAFVAEAKARQAARERGVAS